MVRYDGRTMTLHPKDVISHYRVVAPLGSGGMGEVYLAEDQSLERKVALKVLPSTLTRDNDRVRRFVLEAKSASSLSHPNIVTIYEIGQDVVRPPDGVVDPDSGPVQFISMELVQGKTLSALIHEDGLAVRTLMGYLAQAGEGLAKAHAAGIVHRDVKPTNIMVSADGFAKVLDFGLAKLTEKRESDPGVTSAPTMTAGATSAGTVLGTTAYMSPEQVQGRPLDQRSDIFSFGSVLYEAIARRRPFVADSAVETMHRILHDPPPPIETLNPEAPAGLRQLVGRCLSKAPDQRVQSMREVAAELREIVDRWDAPGAIAAAGRRSWTLPVFAGAGALVVLAAALALWSPRSTRQGVDPQPFQTMRVSMQTTRGDVTDAVISRDGRYLGYLTGAIGRSSVRVRQVATGSDVQVVPSEEGLFEGLSFTPDGNYLFYLRRKRDAPNYRSLMQVASLGGESRERAFDVDSRVSFSPDGKQAAFSRNVTKDRSQAIVVLDLDAGTERVLAAYPTPVFSTPGPAWSPDGRHIAALIPLPVGNLVTTLAVFDVDTGRRVELEASKGGIHESLAWLPDGSGLVRSGWDFATSITSQISLVSYPEGRMRPVTNDLNNYSQVSASAGDEAIAAVRQNVLSNLWRVDASGGEPRPLTKVTNAENSPWEAVTGPDGTIVYSAHRDEGVQLWSLSVAGGEPRRITGPGAITSNPRTFEGGVVYDRYDRSGSVQVWRAGLDGSGARTLTPEWNARLLDVARDGGCVTVIRMGVERDIWSVPLNGGTPSRLGMRTGFTAPISPDGSRVLVVNVEPGEGGLNRPRYEVLPTSGGPPIASFALPPQSRAIAWGPDSASVTFMDQTDPAWNVRRFSWTTEKPEPVTRFAEGRCRLYQWSPDGTQLAVARTIGEATELWITRADGSNAARVTGFRGDEVFDFKWTRDGKSMIVNAGKRGSDAVLIRNFR